jgi:hypothetical protein
VDLENWNQHGLLEGEDRRVYIHIIYENLRLRTHSSGEQYSSSSTYFSHLRSLFGTAIHDYVLLLLLAKSRDNKIRLHRTVPCRSVSLNKARIENYYKTFGRSYEDV